MIKISVNTPKMKTLKVGKAITPSIVSYINYSTQIGLINYNYTYHLPPISQLV